MIKHNSKDQKFRNPTGAVAAGTNVMINLECPEGCRASLVTTINGNTSEIPMSGPVTLTLTEPGVLFYYFRVDGCYYGNATDGLGGEGQMYDAAPTPFRITVYTPDSVPEWYTKGVVYQIFPDRFARSSNYRQLFAASVSAAGPNGIPKVLEEDWGKLPEYSKNPDGSIKEWTFYGGTLEGIRSRLDYIQSLGADIIYLNPIFAARSNHRYDTADFTVIDPLLGSEEDFMRLCSDIHSRGMHIILDGVFNHTGADSIYFNLNKNFNGPGAAQGPKSPYYSWYTFRSCSEPEIPGTALCGGLRYDSWWGVADLPAVNEAEESYKDYIYRSENSVIRKWLRLGADGWRLDVADELPDDFIHGIRLAMLEEKPDSLLLGEVWEDASNKVSYGLLRKYFTHMELQSTMHYPFRDSAVSFMKGEIDAYAFARRMQDIRENYPPANFSACLNLISSHDSPRILTELADGKEDFSWLAINRLKAITLIQFMMPGVPCIYYGDEAGTFGGRDPANRAAFPWGHENAGILEHYRFLGTLRKKHPSLTGGEFSINALSAHVIHICRGDAELLVNRGIFEWETVPYGSGKITLPPLGTQLKL